MLVERPELLKDWLKGELKKISDADPIALGKYILALVKKDKKKDLKTFLLEQLEVFLRHDTSKFVELLLETLHTKSYLKKATVPDDVTMKLSSVVEIPIASSQPTTNVKDSTKKDNLKHNERREKELKTNDLTDKSHSSSTENSGSCVSLKRKNVFDERHNSIEKESCKPSYKNEFADKARQKSSSKLEVKYAPGVPEESKPELEPSPKKTKHVVTHGDTDYRVGKTPIVGLQSTITENVPQQRECPSYSTKPKPSTRCKDYDEKGYCLRGNFCGFDHGSDPILVEHTPNEFLTNFGFLASDKYEGTKSPLPPLPTSPPRIPPPPPPLPPPGFVAEYNPEAPGMNMVTHLNFFNPSEPPPKLPSMMPKCSTRMESLYLKKPDSYIKPKQSRTRELINVTKTVDSSNKFMDKSENKDTKTYLKPFNSVYSTARESGNHNTSKRFDFSRLGVCPRTLEIRKIPSRLNTISNLHQHFAKYGNIVNIEIAVDNDPEAARISFSKNSEATAAYRSTDAILQNRFIKVFWSQHTKKRTDNFFTNFSKEINTRNFSSETFPPENLKGDNISKVNEDGVEKELGEKVNENPLSSMGSMARSVYISNPEAVKKVFPKLTGAKKVTREREEAGGIATHKIKLQKAKAQLLNNAIEHQKLILNQLLKTTKKTEKAFLKKTLDEISKKVEDLTRDLTKENEELKCLLKYNTPQVAVSKIAAKELLDAELDLYKKQHTQNSDEDTTELLLQKVNLMKTKAKALGLLESSSHPHVPKSAFRRNANSRLASLSLRIDHRPKNLLIAGRKSADIEELKKHFNHFGEIEKLEEASEGIVVSFRTRAEAEAAFFYGTKFEDGILNLSWFNDSQLNVSHTPDSNEKPEQKTMEMISVEVEVEDEEEEDEEEARSWRR